MMEYAVEKSPEFNDNYFVASNWFPTCSNIPTHHKNMNYKLAMLSILDYTILNIHVLFLIDKGANVQLVAKYLGHAKAKETSKTYSHLFTSTLDEVPL